MEVSRTTGVAYYRQIAAHLRDKIRAGEIEGRLPSAVDLREEYGVAELTGRRALQFLREQGWARVASGKGTYALPPDRWPPLEDWPEG